MTPLQLIQIIIGLALALFLPGYILARIILREMAGRLWWQLDKKQPSVKSQTRLKD